MVFCDKLVLDMLMPLREKIFYGQSKIVYFFSELCNFSQPLFFSPQFIYLFIYFWLCWVFVAAHRLSLVAASGGYSLLRCTGFSLQWLLLLWSMGSRRTGFSSCSTQPQQLQLAGSRAQAQQLGCTGLVAPRHVGSSRNRARPRVPCLGRRILNQCATRETPKSIILKVNTGIILLEWGALEKCVCPPKVIKKCSYHFRISSTGNN